MAPEITKNHAEWPANTRSNGSCRIPILSLLFPIKEKREGGERYKRVDAGLKEAYRTLRTCDVDLEHAHAPARERENCKPCTRAA